MRSRFIQIFLLVLSSACLNLNAQTEEQDIIERSIEIIAEINEDAEVDYTTLVDELTSYLERPLDLNNASREDLASLRLISDQQAFAIVIHRERFGKFIAVEELQSIPELQLIDIRNIRSFLSVNSDLDALRASPKEIWDNGQHELFMRMDRVYEQPKGFSSISRQELQENPNSRYLGDQWRVFNRYRFKYQNRVSIGFTAEKDAGEELFQGSQQNGFDFFSAHAYLSGFGTIDKAIIGDFHVQMGQGLVIWTGLAFGKSSSLFSLKRNARGVVAYRSVDENAFLRGVATTLKRGDFKLTLFGSSKKRDANVLINDTLDAEEALAFSSLQLSGFHRTPGELEDKDVIQESIAGVQLAYSRGGLSIGARGVALKFDKEFQRSTQAYNQFTFVGDQLRVGGVDYDYVKGNLNMFGEFAKSDNGGFAMVNGAFIVLDPKLSVILHHRLYERNFQGLFSNAIAEGSTPSNERGLITGFIYRPSAKWSFTSWMDRFNHDWLRFGVDAPSQGYELMGKLTYRPNRQVEAYARYRYRDRPKNAVSSENIDILGNTIQNYYRLNISYVVAEGLRFRNRVEFTDFQKEGEGKSRGFLLYHDVVYRPKNFPVDLSVRYALVDAADYDARLYAFEHDVLYFYSIPAYSGVGSRYYLVGKYSITRNIDFWAKWSRVRYLDRDVISSGLNEIDGDKVSVIRMQVRFRF